MTLLTGRFFKCFFALFIILCTNNFNLQAQTAGGLNFDGVNDYVQGNDATFPAGNSARTMQVWMKTTFTGSGSIFEYGTPTNNMRSGILMVNNHLYFVGEGNDLQGSVIINNGLWHHLTVTHDGTTLKIYVDGVLDGSQAKTLNTTLSHFRMGCRGDNTGSELFSGNIDEVRVWNRALSQTEIQNTINCELGTPLTGLVAYYKFNQGLDSQANTGLTTLTDASGNNVNGTLNNFALSGTFSNWVTGHAPTVASITGTSSICNGSNTTLTTSGGSAYNWNTGATTAAIAVTPANSTSYLVTVTNTSGCTASASQTVTVNPLPIASITGTSTICKGQNTTLTAGGGTNYIWSNSIAIAANTVSPAVNTTYSVTVTNASLCTATISKVITVNALPSLSVNTTTDITTICNGGALALNAEVAGTSLFFDGTDDYIEGSDAALPAGNAARSIEVWVKTTFTGGGSMFEYGTPLPGMRAGMMMIFGHFCFTGEFTDLSGTITVNDGNLHQLVFTHDGTTLKLYVDGVLDVSKAASLNTQLNHFRMGCRGDNTATELFNGEVSEVRVWNIALTQAQITSHLTLPVSASTANLVGYLMLDEAAGSFTKDATGKGGNAVLHNNPTWISPITYSWSPSVGLAATTGNNITANPTTTTTYTVIATNSNSCSASISQIITVNPLPLAAITGSATLCTGTSTMLTGSGGTAYAWSDGGTNSTLNATSGSAVTINPTVSTTYSITVTGANACTAISNKAVAVSICTSTWDGGAGDSNWESAANWNPDGVPDSYNAVVLDHTPVSGSYTVNISSAANVRSLTISNFDISLDIKPAYSLQSETIANTGNITVENNASIMQTSPTATITGNGYTVHRDKTNSIDKYNFWTSPVATGNTSMLPSAQHLYRLTPGYGMGSASNFEPWTGAMENGRGYTATNVASAGFIGTPNTGIVNYSLQRSVTYSSNTNLVGNPYPSAINALSFTNANSASLTSATVYLWNQQQSGTAGFIVSQNFIAVNAIGTSDAFSFSGQTLASTNIASCQGFEVAAATNGATLTFNNSMRNTNNSSFYRVAKTAVSERAWLTIQDRTNVSSTLIALSDSATTGKDFYYDAPTGQSSSSLQITSLIDSATFAIQSLPANTTANTEIPLAVTIAKPGTVTFTLAKEDNIQAGRYVYLLDKETNTYNDLRQGSKDIAFASAGKVNERFALVFSISTATGITENTTALSNWSLQHNANGALVIKLNTLNDYQSYEVFDVAGKLLLQAKTNNQTDITLPIETTGLVLVRMIKTGGTSESKKIIKN